jgi:hypothetical protein
VGGFFARSWCAWGDFDVDYGREMYVPLRLVEGDVLYRDVRYPYGPFSPYLHAAGYWLWKPDVAVLYASGMVAMTAVVLVLYAIARRFTTSGVAFLATVLTTVDLMCIPGGEGTFSYVFPYAFPALHGLLFLLIAVAGGLALLNGGGRTSALVAGAGIGFALLAKPEFGGAALGFGVLVAILVGVTDRPHASARVATLAASALGVAACGYRVLALFVPLGTIAGRGLFAPEYFAAAGPIFAIIAGFRPNAGWREIAATLVATWATSAALYVAVVAVAAAGGLAVVLVRTLRPASGASRPGLARAVGATVALATIALIAAWRVPVVPYVLYPNLVADLPRYGGIPLLLVGLLVTEAVRLVARWRRGEPADRRGACRLAAAAVALALLVRTPASLLPRNYANFYLPLALVLGVHLLVDVVPHTLARVGIPVDATRAATVTMVAVLAIGVGVVRYRAWGARDIAVHTRRGTLVVASRDVPTAAYRETLAWLEKEAPPDATVVAIPRGTSLSFLAARGNHLYEVSLVGVIPDAAAEAAYVQALERDPPTLIVTSDQAQGEYGRGAWGVKDNASIAAWVRAHYEPVHATERGWFHLTIWRHRDAVAAAPAALPSPDDALRTGSR